MYLILPTIKLVSLNQQEIFSSRIVERIRNNNNYLIMIIHTWSPSFNLNSYFILIFVIINQREYNLYFSPTLNLNLYKLNKFNGELFILLFLETIALSLVLLIRHNLLVIIPRNNYSLIIMCIIRPFHFNLF